MNLRRLHVAIGLIVAVIAARPATVRAQTRVSSPHGALATPCGQCHTATAWKPARIAADFKHPTTFALEGAHARTSCTSCHRSLEFKQVASTCVGCHTDVHRGELGADCARCHTPRSFIDRAAMVRAHQASRFPLTGVHAAVDCVACHTPAAQGQLQFVNRPTQCESCHLAEAVVVKDPDHQAAGFTRQCERCHSPTVWNRARFDHAATAFPLTGAHVRATCQQCHADRVYSGKSAECVSCHRTDYSGTTNPAHAAATFPTTCASCHTTSTWAGARFDHDGPYFPIYSGAHRGRWNSCSTCHTNAASFAVFTCLTCHGQTETNGHHQSVSGYRYDSQACYSCHRNGRSR
jgi:hypothetical protein